MATGAGGAGAGVPAGTAAVAVNDVLARMAAMAGSTGTGRASRPRRAVKRFNVRCANPTQNNASQPDRMGNMSEGKCIAAAPSEMVKPPGARRTGTVSSVTNGSAINPPARRARGPKRRIHIDSAIPSTYAAAPAAGAFRNSQPIPTQASVTAGSTNAASMRPRRSRSIWLRPSDTHSTTASTAAPGCGSMRQTQNRQASAASMTAMASVPALARRSRMAIRVLSGLLESDDDRMSCMGMAIDPNIAPKRDFFVRSRCPSAIFPAIPKDRQ